MFVNVRELAKLNAPLVLRGSLDAENAADGRNDLKVTGPIRADLSARYEDGTVFVTGDLSADCELVCSRCLRVVKDKLSFPVTEMFTLRRDVAERDEEIHFVRDELIDLDPYLRESFAVQLPMAALCEESCKGLCPVCGADRNVGQCGCSEERIDPRLEVLKDFFRK